MSIFLWAVEGDVVWSEQFLWALGWSGHPQTSLPAHRVLVASTYFSFTPAQELSFYTCTWGSVGSSSKSSVPRSPGLLCSLPPHLCSSKALGVPECFLDKHNWTNTAKWWQDQGLALRTTHNEVGGGGWVGKVRGARERFPLLRTLNPCFSLGACPRSSTRHTDAFWKDSRTQRNVTCFLFFFPMTVPLFLYLNHPIICLSLLGLPWKNTIVHVA